MAFDTLTEEELAAERRRICAATIEAAQLAAAGLLVSALGADIGSAETVVKVLTNSDHNDHRRELLEAFEKRWSLLVLRLLAGTVARPEAAVLDARQRGATVPEIAAALGLTTQGIYAKFRDQIVGQRQPSRQR